MTTPPEVAAPNIIKMFLRVLGFTLALIFTPTVIGGAVWGLAWWHGAPLRFFPTLVTVWAVLVGYAAHVLVMRWAVRPRVTLVESKS